MKYFTLAYLILAAPSCPNIPNPVPTPTPIPPTTTTTTLPIPPPTTIPPVNIECFPPDGNAPGWVPIGQQTPTREVEVSTAKSVVGEQCGKDGYVTTEKVAKELRIQKLCAGRDNDAVLVLQKGSTIIWEEWKVVAFNNGCWTGNPYKGNWRFDGETSPSPSPIPSPNTCPVSVSGDYFVDVVISHIGQNAQLYTETTKYCGFPVRSDVFPACGTKCCVLGVDGGSDTAIACDKELFGDPIWTWDGTLDVVSPWGDNPYNVKVNSGSGNLKVCGSKGPCNSVVIQ